MPEIFKVGVLIDEISMLNSAEQLLTGNSEHKKSMHKSAPTLPSDGSEISNVLKIARKCFDTLTRRKIRITRTTRSSVKSMPEADPIATSTVNPATFIHTMAKSKTFQCLRASDSCRLAVPA